MNTKLLYTQGNLFKGYPWGVEAVLTFEATELHGPFGSENEANNYAHQLVRNPASDGRPYESVKVVKIETPQAGKRIIRDETGRDGPYKYAV